jgi:hypothetical protein
MGIRRRRKKLTSLISNMDKRIRTVEFKKTAYGVTSTTEEVSANEEVSGNEPAGSVYSPTLPNPWTRVQRAYFHPSNVVAGDRFEILMYNTNGIESVSGSSAERGDFVSISALGRSAAPIITVGRTYFKNTNVNNPYYTCRAHGTPSWSLSSTNTRESLKFNGNQVYIPLPISGDTFGTVTHTYLFSHGSSVTANGARYSLATRALIASHSATTTTATLTISGTSHHYSADDIIDVNDLPEAYRGIDGLFKVKSVTSTTISYDFDTPLSEAISSATASSGTYIYSVAQKYVRVGSTWFDTANNDKVYYWNGLRYQSSQVEGLSNDGSAPSPPTNLTLSTSGYNRGTDGSPRSRVDLSWTAPTTSANGNTLDDLLGYKIRVSESGYSNWRDTRDLNGRDTSETITGLDPNKQYYFRVTAYDSFGNESTGLDGTIVTGLAALSVEKPSAPTIPTPRLGIVQVSWDGKDYNGAVVPIELINFIEVHGSTTSGFTPGSGTLLGKIYSKNAPAAISNLTYNATYYFKLVAVDKNGNSSDASTQTATQIRPLVDTDIIGKVLNGANIVNGSITASEAIIGETITGALIQGLTINAGHIESNSITTDRLQAGTMTGFTIQTSTGNTAVILSAADNSLSVKVNGTVAAYLTGTYDSTWGYGAMFGLGNIGDPYSSNVFFEVDSSIIRGPANVAGLAAWRNSGSGYLDLWADTQMFLASGSISMNNGSSDSVDIAGGLIVNGAAGLYVQNRIDAYGRIAAPSFAIWGVGTVITTTGGVAPVSGTTTSAANVRQPTSGDSLLRVVSSSGRYKNTVVDINSVDGLNPRLLLNLPVRAFKYNTDYLNNPEDPRYDALMPGFIAEEVEQFYEAAVDYNEDNVPESWNERMMVPSMLALIQDLYRQIDELKQR